MIETIERSPNCIKDSLNWARRGDPASAAGGDDGELSILFNNFRKNSGFLRAIPKQDQSGSDGDPDQIGPEILP